MVVRFAAAVTVLASALLPFTAARASGTDVIGRAVIVRGKVSVERGQLRVPISVGEPIFSGDTLHTGHAGEVRVIMADRSLLDLRRAAELKIVRYGLTWAHPGGEMALDLKRGTLWAGMRELMGQRHLTVDVPGGAQVTGTRHFSVHAAPESAFVFVRAHLGTATLSPGGDAAPIPIATGVSLAMDGEVIQNPDPMAVGPLPTLGLAERFSGETPNPEPTGPQDPMMGGPPPVDLSALIQRGASDRLPTPAVAEEETAVLKKKALGGGIVLTIGPIEAITIMPVSTGPTGPISMAQADVGVVDSITLDPIFLGALPAPPGPPSNGPPDNNPSDVDLDDPGPGIADIIRRGRRRVRFVIELGDE